MRTHRHRREPRSPSVRFPRRLHSCSPLLLALLAFAAGCAGSHSTAGTHPLSISGSVHGGQAPVTGSTIQLYAVGTSGDGSQATPLITATVTTSDGSGNAANSNANAGNSFRNLCTSSATAA